MARSYLGRSGGFSDGFASGFGLMNSAINNKRKLDTAEEELQYQRGQDTLNRDREQRNFEASELRSTRQFGLQQAARERANILAEAQLGLEGTKIGQAQARLDIDERVKDAQIDASEAAARASEKEQRDLKGQQAIFQIGQIAESLAAGGERPDMAVISDLISQTEGSLYDINNVMGNDYGARLANLTSTLTDDLSNGTFDPSNPAYESGFDAVIMDKQGALIGQVVDKSFVNAPDAYKDGTWVVKKRESTDIRDVAGSDSDGRPQAFVTTDVLVTLEKKDDPSKVATYIAPLTESRNQGDSNRMLIPVNTLFDGIAGSAVYSDYLTKSGMSNLIKASKIEDMGGNANFQKLRNINYEAILTEAQNRPTSDGILSGTANEKLTTEQLMKAAEDRTLGLGRRTGSYRDDARLIRIQTRDALSKMMGNNYKVEKDGQNVALKPEDFSAKELFELRSTFNENGGQTPETRDMLKAMTESRGGAFEGRIRLTDKLASGLSNFRMTPPKANPAIAAGKAFTQN